MIIGIPKEILNNENRVSLTPAGAYQLCQQGHTVLVDIAGKLRLELKIHDFHCLVFLLEFQ